ncbi:hypothetical protein [Candidatus Uabimicrobium sp. HlEnr_7]|uniref:hypothetical protein n=1 Tax=Candidatus Uabimicrobium helgolandensis TaxID=3095367 RepID=UPI003557A617
MKYNIQAINPVESRVLADPQFQIALDLGKVRKGHLEGQLGYHIENILQYIEANFKSDRDYEKLRIIGIIHDMGKLGELVDNINKYMPSNAKNSKFYLEASQNFIKEIGKQPDKGYVPAHAMYSYEFAKKHTIDKQVLEVIKFHDTAFRLSKLEKTLPYKIYKKIGIHIKKVFASLDNELMLKFMEVDNSGRDTEIVTWLKTKLQKEKII